MKHLGRLAIVLAHALMLGGCGPEKADDKTLLGPRQWREQPFINSLGMKFIPVIVDEKSITAASMPCLFVCTPLERWTTGGMLNQLPGPTTHGATLSMAQP